MYNLFLDDNFTPYDISNLPKTNIKDIERYRKYKWICVRTYEEFILAIKDRGLPNIVSFDHDLAPEHYEVYNEENFLKNDNEIFLNYDIFEEKTGYHAAEWLMEYCATYGLELPICLVHSQNDVGRKNIINLLF